MSATTASSTSAATGSSSRDIEFTCSNPNRATGTAGSGPGDMRRGGISSHGSHNVMANLVIHDTNGAGFWGR